MRVFRGDRVPNHWTAPPRTGSPAHRVWRPVLAGAMAGVLLLRAPHGVAASFEPGTEADPPTGALPVAAPLPAEGQGIRWELAPLAVSGNVALDGRWLDFGDGARSTQFLTVGDIEFATYVWQPWFVQLRAGLGFVMARDTTRLDGAPPRSTSSPASTGRVAVSVFPMSRFPFELRAEVTDSRVQGDALGTGYRASRFSLSQAYAPEAGGDNYHLHLDHSRRTTFDGVSDVVTSVGATASRHWDQQVLDLSAQHVSNRRSDTGDSSSNSALTLHHNYNPTGSLQVDSLASLNDSRLEGGDGADGFEVSTNIRQVSSFASWRPRAGEWLYSEKSPVSVSGSVRLVDSQLSGNGVERDQQAMSVSLGVNQDLTQALRLSGSASATLVSADDGPRRHFGTASAAASYTPAVVPLGDWRYSPSLGANLGVSRSSERGREHTVGAQASHSASRSYALGDSDNLSLSFAQSLGVTRDAAVAELARQLTHAASLSWQGQYGPASQSYASLSFSDSRTRALESSRFQLVNLQLSRTTQLSRDASWSGHLTLQASRSRSRGAAVVALEGLPSNVDDSGTQRFYGGSLNYEHRRIWGVPRLRFTASLSLNSQQLESRSLGDIDAPRERISKAVEGRLDYAIGRLDTRLTTRWVEADRRRIASVYLRVQRHF